MNKISCNYTKHGNENISITAFFNYYVPKTKRGTIFKLIRTYKIKMKVISISNISPLILIFAHTKFCPIF